MMGHRAVKLIALLTLLAPIAQSATWKTLDAAGYHRPREETTLAACGGTSLCLLGGRNRVPTPVLDTATLKWTEGPAPPIELHHFQGVRGPDGCAWVLGAWTGKFPGETAVDTIFRYCVADAVWQQVGTIARPRGAGGVAFHNGLFYLVTGNVGGHQKSAKLVPWFDAYNPKTKTWTQLPDIPNARDHVNVVVANNKLYVAGGRDSSDSYPKFFSLVETNVDVYDFMTGAWSTLPSGFPRGRAGAPAISYRGVPWVAGGEGSGRAWTEVDALSGNAFVPGPAMLHPRHGFGMYECNNVIWVAGGAGVQGGGAPQMKLDAYFDGVNPVPCTFSASTTITPKPSSITVKTPSTEAIVEPESGSSGPAVSSPTDASASAGSTPNQAETPVNSEAPGTKGPSASTPNGKTITSPNPLLLITISPSATASSSVSRTEVAIPFASAKAYSMPSVGAVQTSVPTMAAVVVASRAPAVSPFEEPSPSINLFSDALGRGGEQGIVQTSNATAYVSASVSMSVTASAITDISMSASISPFVSLSATAVPSLTSTQFDTALTTSTPELLPSVVPTPITNVPLDISTGASSSPLTATPSLTSTPSWTSSPSLPSSLSSTSSPSYIGDSNAVGDKEISPNSAKEISSTTEAPKNENTCFPGHATVQMEGGYEKRMEDLQIGDRVLVSHPDTYSEVYFFSHAHAEHVGNFVNIRTELDDVALQVSSRHLVYANGEVVEAQHVAKGDQLFIAHDRRLISVTSVEQVSSKGLYNPHTLHGDIIVNRVVATTYTRTLHPRIARILLHPFHAAYRIAGPHPVIHAVNRGVLRLLENVVW